MTRELRYELKYRLERLPEYAVKQEVMLHPAGFKSQHPDRIINNVYFDTPELTTLQENLAGISERNKYRLRWYGKQQDIVTNGRWEIKAKMNTLGLKYVQNVEGTFHLSALNVLVDRINQKYHLGYHITPSLVNRYVRSYYVTPDQRFRITIDRELEYFPVGGAGAFTRYAYHDDAVILELKFDKQHEDAAQRILEYLPYRQTKSSKYVNGLLMLI